MRVRCNPIVRPLCFLLFLLSAGIASAQLTGAASADAVSRLNAIRDDSYAGNRVDTSTGAFVMALPAISVQGGREVAVALRYNSLLTQNRGRLGFGWSHEYEAFIEGDPAGVVTVWWDANRRNTFRFAGSGNAYEPLDEAVRYDKLRREPNDSWHLTRFDGTVYEFEAIAMGGKLERLGNKVRQFLDMVYVDGRLREIRESIGNRFLTLHYRRDGSGLLDTIQDQLDRLVHFEYDSNARLASLRAPVSPGLAFGESFVPKDIPDNNSDGITHNIVVARAEPIGLVFLTASNISHQDPTQLRVLLTSPGGTTLQFTTNSTNPSWDFTDTVLAAFDGENPEGTWRVRVIDNVAGGTGRLNGWRMRFTNVTDETRFAYDGANRLAIARGPDDAILYRNWFDPQGRVMQQDDGRADNELALFSYSENAAGVTATYQDRAGAEWQFQHDAGHHLTSLRDPLNASTAYAYNSRRPHPAHRRAWARHGVQLRQQWQSDHRRRPAAQHQHSRIRRPQQPDALSRRARKDFRLYLRQQQQPHQRQGCPLPEQGLPGRPENLQWQLADAGQRLGGGRANGIWLRLPGTGHLGRSPRRALGRRSGLRLHRPVADVERLRRLSDDLRIR
jgi:subtilisin-like proprotein convertase family protein